MPGTIRLVRLRSVMGVVGTVAALLTGAPAQAAPDPDPLTARQQTAARALAVAQDVLDGTEGRPTREATLTLRDLAISYQDLTGSRRAAARRLLEPPATTEVACDAAICVHWSTTSAAPDPTDTTPANGTPDQVDLTLRTMQDVRETYLAAGYRPPKPDGVSGGGTDTFDVYLDDTGADGTYGFCATDDAESIPDNGPYDAAAYCVLDNDFAADQFPTHTPTQNLQVTAAHEYFHAVQYAYDFLEERWLIESTATWAEDELYDDVDDNVQYLPESPITHPRTPLDTYSPGNGFHYGTWIFWRYLTERFPRTEGALPRLVLDVWRRAGGATGDPDDGAMRATSRVLAGRGTTLPKTLVRFADANLRARSAYREGSALGYPTTRPRVDVQLSPSRRSAGTTKIALDHLTAATARLSPRRTSSAWKLHVRLDLSSQVRSAAYVTSTLTDGSLRSRTIYLDAKGRGAISLPFASAQVTRVDVTVVNASALYACGDGSASITCFGAARDDDRTQRISAFAYR